MKKYFILLLLASQLFGESHYEEAYNLEKTNTLFAIPLYEKALVHKPTGKLQKAVVSRLFYLYKKHNKILDALFLGSRFPSIITSKDRAWIWNDLGEIYKPLSITELSSTYVFVAKAKENQTLELSEHLKQFNSPKLYEFASILLLKRKQYKSVLEIFESNPTMAVSPIFIGISEIKSKEDFGKEYLKTILAESELEKSDLQKSDILYLMGMYYRLTDDIGSSVRYFRMSGSFALKNRSISETFKSLVLNVNPKEACSLYKISPSKNDEIELLIHYFCTNDPVWRTFRPSIKVLANREGNEFLNNLFFSENQ
ncbi:hypothetical protein P3G55_13810 [Leptospira sp. 96542]|nr:hypothetical protein [Leptospira sp. 96542]